MTRVVQTLLALLCGCCAVLVARAGLRRQEDRIIMESLRKYIRWWLEKPEETAPPAAAISLACQPRWSHK
jgi:hypothetical protein